MKIQRHWQLIALGFVVSLLTVLFIVNELNLNAVSEAMSAAHLGYIIPCVLLLLGGLVCRAIRWRILLGGVLPISRTFHIMNIAYLVNGVLPLRIGEVVRAFLASRGSPSVPVMTTAGSVVVERILDLLAIVLLVAYALVVGPVPVELRSAGIFFGIAGISGFLLLLILVRQRSLSHGIVTIMQRRLRVLRRLDLAALLDHFLDGLLPLSNLRTLMLAVLWTAIGWVWSIAAGYVLMYAFYDSPSLVATMLYIAAAALAIAVPATMANIGVYEASIMLALSAFAFGRSSETAFAFAITVHAVNVGVHTLTGILGFFMEGLTWIQLSMGVQELTEDVDSSREKSELERLSV